MPTSIVYDENDEFFWSSIERVTSQDGILENKITIYDNGIEKYESYYENGQKFHSLQTDTADAKFWSKIDAQYEEDGSLEQRTIVKDDGGYTQWDYDFGLVLQKTELDGEVNGGSKSWAARLTSYDESGNKAEVQIVYDDFRVSTETFNNDGSRDIHVTDASADGAGFNWQVKDTARDENGDLEHTLTIYDNNDATSFLYDAGARSNRLDIDGDDSHSWYAREIIYDSNGNKVDIVYYDNAAEIPTYWEEDLIAINNPV
jgi:hypothetical protein